MTSKTGRSMISEDFWISTYLEFVQNGENPQQQQKPQASSSYVGRKPSLMRGDHIFLRPCWTERHLRTQIPGLQGEKLPLQKTTSGSASVHVRKRVPGYSILSLLTTVCSKCFETCHLYPVTCCRRRQLKRDTCIVKDKILMWPNALNY